MDIDFKSVKELINVIEHSVLRDFIEVHTRLKEIDLELKQAGLKTLKGNSTIETPEKPGDQIEFEPVRSPKQASSYLSTSWETIKKHAISQGMEITGSNSGQRIKLSDLNKIRPLIGRKTRKKEDCDDS